MAPTNIKTVHQTSLLHIETNLDRLGLLSPTQGQRSQQQSGQITLQRVLINKAKFFKTTNCTKKINGTPRSMVIKAFKSNRRLVIAVAACCRTGGPRPYMCCAGVCTCSALDVRKTYHLHVARVQSNQITCVGTSESVYGAPVRGYGSLLRLLSTVLGWRPWG